MIFPPGPLADLVFFVECRLYGFGGGFRRYAFAIRSLFILFLHVHHVPYDFRVGAGRYGRLYQESLFLYRDGSRRRRFQSDADGIYRRGEYGAGLHRPVDRFLVYLVFRYQMQAVNLECCFLLMESG